ncbi:hypothetical protein PM082_015236 [Marasmius tenuissimus]|nr:hypothetical protein PM082_015236 [Marasmius tenuissimus]
MGVSIGKLLSAGDQLDIHVSHSSDICVCMITCRRSTSVAATTNDSAVKLKIIMATWTCDKAQVRSRRSSRKTPSIALRIQ